MRPIVTAAHLGYAMVGELIDPQDWNLWKGELGYQTRRTPEDILQSVLEQVSSQKANTLETEFKLTGRSKVDARPVTSHPRIGSLSGHCSRTKAISLTSDPDSALIQQAW